MRKKKRARGKKGKNKTARGKRARSPAGPGQAGHSRSSRELKPALRKGRRGKKKTARGKKAASRRNATRKKRTALRKRLAPNWAAPEEKGPGADAGGQSGDIQGLSGVARVDSESVAELAEEGQAFEAEVVSGVENAPDADVRTEAFDFF